MSGQHRILVVDDTLRNVKLLADILSVKGYDVVTASSGPEALELVDRERPDLILLDVVMPEMSGYEVCRKIRQNPETSLLPVVMVTALDPREERVKGIEAGADDFLSKPINNSELLARVRSLLRIRQLHETVQSQAAELAEWNKKLEQRVQEQTAQLQRLERLKGFFSPQIAEMIADGGNDLLKAHRRKVVMVFVDLRGFTPFSETAEPEEVMGVLGEYHAEAGRLIKEFGGTLEHFAGDGMMIFFNDPLEVPNPEERAVRMAVATRDALLARRTRWIRLGYELGIGIGITSGHATLGVIGYEERWEYAVIGSVANQVARLCAAAEHGQILISERLLTAVNEIVETESIGELALKGFHRPLKTHNILRLRGESNPG